MHQTARGFRKTADLKQQTSGIGKGVEMLAIDLLALTLRRDGLATGLAEDRPVFFYRLSGLGFWGTTLLLGWTFFLL